MTKERLEELAGSIFQGEYDWEICAEHKSDLEELIRLARLGLWASTHREVIRNTLYSAATLDTALALEELPDAAR